MTAPIISLLIVTCNRKDSLARTLNVMLPRLLPEHEIVVFDNGSSDGTAALVAEQFPEVKLITQATGIPYMAARNTLLGVAQGEYAISLDDDAEIVTPEFVARIKDHFAQYPRCGVIAFSIFWGEELPPAATSSEASRRVSSYVGCGHAWRMKAWKSIREYPAWFEFYGEEDFASLDLLRHQWEVHYLPRVLVHHRVNMAKRKADEAQRLWRYSRQLRGGIFVLLLFYPLRVLPKRLPYAFWTQLRLRLIKARDWRVLPCLLWVMKEILRNAPQIIRARAPLNETQWREWNQLPPAVVYWEPSARELKLTPEQVAT